MRGPRLRNSSTTPAIATGLPPKNDRPPSALAVGLLGFEVIGDAPGDESRQIVDEAIDGMARDGTTQGLAFRAQADAVGPLGLIGRLDAHCLGHLRGTQAENVVLAGFIGLAVLLAQRERRVESMHQRGAVGGQAVERAGLDQCFQHAPIDLRQVQPAA